MKSKSKHDIILVILAIIFCIVGFLFLREFFDKDLDNFSIEILAAVLGSVFTVAAMTVVIKMQARQETEKEFSARLFERKIQVYDEFLAMLFQLDDDNVLSEDEIQDIENKIGEIALVANSRLVSVLSQFMLQIKIYGCVYPRSMNEKQIQHFIEYFDQNHHHLSITKKHLKSQKHIGFNDLFIALDEVIQGIRTDLSVVEGDIEEMLGHFIELPVNKYKLFDNPNLVD
ncbi:MAG: hypothetical protein JXB49_10350 [Bacteroidales bacterium]|nr:hypothetical protein [Bacteroidales bacterium]